ncbi:arsenate reductase (glutaredoxin) [Rufibacter sp. LB8]|uniref:arsenate reductase (glutaredoxin) n=1 Tax=Rufibacter sp. LB8 TaxID=2777781 RepID=UPI00178C3208|nr:arsenate reductase (glutaredoxin) [Rufibacter sp. LB8]
MITIYHNNRCSKSRETLALLENSTQPVNVINYLTSPPTVAELRDLLAKLQLGPEDIIRKGEALYKEVYATQHLTADEWLQVLTQNPVLIERPIVVHGDKAVIGRPPQNVLTIL